MDDDGNSSLVFEEFSNGIAESGLKVPPEIMRALFDQFDSDGSGSVSINEFLLAVRVSVPLMLTYKKKITKKLQKNLKNYKKIYKNYKKITKRI